MSAYDPRVRTIATLAAVSLALAAVVSTAVMTGARAAINALPELPPAVDIGDIDDLSEAVERDIAVPSTVFAADGTVIGRFKSGTTHLRLTAAELPTVVTRAVVAAEDGRFWEHAGFDLAAIVRAFTANLDDGTVAQGGSTITQQVAKLLFTGDDQTLARKVAEVRTAIELEDRFPKSEILAAYLNSVYFGGGAFGVEAAATEFLRKPASELTLGEAALLAGVIPAPTAFDPRRHPDRAEARRQHVLDRLAEMGWYTTEEIEAARAQPVVIHPPLPAIERYPYFLDYVRRYLLDVLGVPAEDVYGAGLEIRTTLQPRIQDAAVESVARNLPGTDGPTASVVVVDHVTGGVAALVGGRDFESSKVNLALGTLGAGSGRQAGSAFKPFVLGAALERGYSLRDRVAAPEQYLPRSVVDPKPIHNYDQRGHGVVTLADATRRSINTAYVGLAEQIGAGAVAEFATRTGITSLPEPDAVGPSIAIGAYEVSPLDMAAAYGTFAAEGRRVHVSPLVSVSSGSIDVAAIPAGRGEQVMAHDTALMVTDALQDVVRSGTARSAAIDRPVAAKTGTSNDHGNAWLVGYSPQLSTAVWVGDPAGNVPMHNVNGVARVTGGSIPARIWSEVMAVAHEGLPVLDFPPAPDRPATKTARLTPRAERDDDDDRRDRDREERDDDDDRSDRRGRGRRDR